MKLVVEDMLPDQVKIVFDQHEIRSLPQQQQLIAQRQRHRRSAQPKGGKGWDFNLKRRVIVIREPMELDKRQLLLMLEHL